ncbi:glycosyltransferase [Actimicrobium sp. CCC2.4]|uniref:glycosyltransferase family 2 protein n=1 Tax=Actimicrobium sp. CCC2.4 TaxID=3048606 RepID=UPI002AC9E82E|nr:glycosyltransferase [Actimicrobium sp. CCC2.4]MEB0136028.1 glycosyltransferase [Actimicrobium sp. CCC2.4]WPX32691.1 glycosyltransferase [Actimicrobium sp. CCC2.4]
MKKISVIIPVFNGAQFIAETVRSVLRQTYKDYELIIVNDGSADGTLEKLKEFGMAVNIISIPNGGVSNARNTGIKASCGEYIAFLDADDLWEENKLERQMKVFEQYPDVGFCCCNYVQENNGVNHFDLFSDDHALIIDAPMSESSVVTLINSNFVGTCSNVIIRKSVLSQTGLFNTALKQAEDYDLWLRCSLVTNFFVMSDVLIIKINHETNLTNNQLETWQCHEKVLMMRLSEKIYVGRKSLITLTNKKLSEAQYYIGDMFFNKSEYLNCLKYYISALRSNKELKNYIIFLSYILKKASRLILEFSKVRVRYREN